MSYVSLNVKIDYAQAVADYNKLIRELNGRTIDLKINPTSGRVTQQTLREVTASTENLTSATNRQATANAGVATSQARVNRAVQDSGNIFTRFGQTMSHNIAKMLEWGISGTIIYGTLRKIGEGVKYITEMDTALADIRMASGMTREETQGLAQDYLNLGKSLGIAVEEIATSAKELYRQGLNTQEVNDRLADYIKLSKVLGRDLASTIEIGTAGATTFGTTIERIGDVATAVGDATASSGDEIMIAIQKGGMAAQTAGVSLEQYAAMAATISSTTRESGAVVGNSMKSILSKMSQVNDLTGDINEDFGKTLKAMQKVGVQTTDESGNLLNATTILNNLGSSWEDLSEKEQKYVANTFGVYQVNRFTALLKGMTTSSDEYIQNLETAYDSFGSVAKKYEEYSNTIEASTARMSNEFKELVQNTINSDFLITLINAGASLVDFIDKSNLLQVALISLISYFTMLGVTMAGSFMVSMAGVAMSFVETIALTNSLSAGLRLLAANASMAGLGMRTAFGIGAIAVAGLVYAFRTADEELKKSKTSAEQITKTYETQRQSVVELMQGISDLKDKQSLSKEENMKLEGTYKALLKIMPSIQGAIEGQVLSWENVTAAVMETAEAERQHALQQLKLKKANIKTGEGALSQVSSDNFGIKSAIKGTVSLATSQIEAIQAEIDKVEGAKLTIDDIVVDTPDKPNGPPPGAKDSKTSEDILKQFASYRQEIDKTKVSISALEAEEEMLKAQELNYSTAIQAQIEEYQNKQDEIHKYAEALRLAQSKLKEGSDDWNKLEDEIINQQQAWTDAEKSIASCTDEIADFQRKAEEALKKTREEAEKLADTLGKKVLDKLKELEREYDREKDAIEERYRISIEGAKDELDAFKRKNEALEAEAERNKILLELEKARLRIKNILNEQNVQLYTGSGATGWEWVADPQAVKEAQEAVFDLEENLREYDVEENKRATEQKLQDEINALERAKDAEIRAFEVRKQKFNDFLYNIELAMKGGHEITKEMTDTWLSSLTTAEQESYRTRIEDAIKFVNDYNAQMALLAGMQVIPGQIRGQSGRNYSAEEQAKTGIGSSSASQSGTYHPDGSFTPKAGGGTTSVGKTYRVDEAGTEGFQWEKDGKTYIKPLVDGKVITANNMQKMLAGNNGQSIVFNGDVNLPNVTKPSEFFPELIRKTKTISNNTR